MNESKNSPSRNRVSAASNSIADKQLREAILDTLREGKKPGYADWRPSQLETRRQAQADQILALFHTYGNRERVDELEHIDNKPNVRLWFDGFYGVDDRIKELNREVES